ncbi:hypothetical protein MAR_020876 [Mya arenaria]|uniref:Uncharacterized protein n=1 Tax=Mya arenaria TaxID=6604 RepID=A0ABY7E975_MYAAR|nr:hypothetical protein MAR_020876 [Mya arenaria]
MVNNNRLRVCKNMFLRTLGIGEKTLYQWVKDCHAVSGIPVEKECNRCVDITLSKRIENILAGFPKMESHFCRSSSCKMYLEPTFDSKAEVYTEYSPHSTARQKSTRNMYLEPTFDSKAKVYTEYVADSERQNIPHASQTLFKTVFEKMNFGLYWPKKGLCDLCCTYKAVVLCPRLNTSALYYKTKLLCYNFTVKDLESKDDCCYFWTESEGLIRVMCCGSFGKAC